jgi:hypothetical protein
MVLLQKALESGRLDEATTARVQTLLDERARQYLRNMTPSPGGPSYDADWMTLQATPWRQRDRELFALAAEVAGKVGDRK